jgi:hypothetical protein
MLIGGQRGVAREELIPLLRLEQTSLTRRTPHDGLRLITNAREDQMIQSSPHNEGCRAPAAVGALLAMLLCSAAAWAEGSNLGYGGGARTPAAMREYEGMDNQYNASGERFRIRGRCQSACTMLLSIKNVCVERSARVRFHGGRSPLSTAQMKGHYNPRLRGYLDAGGHMDTTNFHTISGSELISRFGYKECPARR